MNFTTPTKISSDSGRCHLTLSAFGQRPSCGYRRGLHSRARSQTRVPGAAAAAASGAVHSSGARARVARRAVPRPAPRLASHASSNAVALNLNSLFQQEPHHYSGSAAIVYTIVRVVTKKKEITFQAGSGLIGRL